jgi:hypothetical protein
MSVSLFASTPALTSAILSMRFVVRCETMVKVLTDSLVRIYGEVGGSEHAWAHAETRIGRELQKLQYLIDAAVSALRTPSSDRPGAVATSSPRSNQMDVSTPPLPPDATGSSRYWGTEAGRQRQQRRQAQEQKVQAMLAGARKRNDATVTVTGCG